MLVHGDAATAEKSDLIKYVCSEGIMSEASGAKAQAVKINSEIQKSKKWGTIIELDARDGGQNDGQKGGKPSKA